VSVEFREVCGSLIIIVILKIKKKQQTGELKKRSNFYRETFRHFIQSAKQTKEVKC
jgi:hypothetical protein